MKRYLVFIVLSVVFFSCSKDDVQEQEYVEPVLISYNAQNVFVKNTTQVLLVPTVAFTMVSYSISPALPLCLGFDTRTGVISGRPCETAVTTTYTVTATDSSGGQHSFNLVITVNDRVPSSLSYNAQNLFVKNYSVVNLIPTIYGGAVSSYRISPALPAGLSINVATGVISGTPTVDAATATYTVTASNVTGSTSFGIEITVAGPYPIPRIESIRFWNASQTYYTKTIYYFYQNNLISGITEADNERNQTYTSKSFYYNSGRLNKMITQNGNRYGSGPGISTNYFYTNDLITSDATPYWNANTTYGYDSNDRLVSVNGINRFEYYSDGNLYKVYASDPANNVIYSSYDTKNNPFRLGGFTSEYLKLNAIPFNNPTSMNNETYVYEYNASDYPIKKTTYINGVVQSVTTYTYE